MALMRGCASGDAYNDNLFDRFLSFKHSLFAEILLLFNEGIAGSISQNFDSNSNANSPGFAIAKTVD